MFREAQTVEKVGQPQAKSLEIIEISRLFACFHRTWTLPYIQAREAQTFNGFYRLIFPNTAQTHLIIRTVLTALACLSWEKSARLKLRAPYGEQMFSHFWCGWSRQACRLSMTTSRKGQIFAVIRHYGFEFRLPKLYNKIILWYNKYVNFLGDSDNNWKYWRRLIILRYFHI